MGVVSCDPAELRSTILELLAEHGWLSKARLRSLLEQQEPVEIDELNAALTQLAGRVDVGPHGMVSLREEESMGKKKIVDGNGAAHTEAEDKTEAAPDAAEVNLNDVDLERSIVDYLRRHPAKPLVKSEVFQAMNAALGTDTGKLFFDAVDKLEQAGIIILTGRPSARRIELAPDPEDSREAELRDRIVAYAQELPVDELPVERDALTQAFAEIDEALFDRAFVLAARHPDGKHLIAGEVPADDVPTASVWGDDDDEPESVPVPKIRHTAFVPFTSAEVAALSAEMLALDAQIEAKEAELEEVQKLVKAKRKTIEEIEASRREISKRVRAGGETREAQLGLTFEQVPAVTPATTEFREATAS